MLKNWNPHNLPISRPFLVIFKHQNVVTCESVINLTPKEDVNKQGILVNINFFGFVSFTNNPDIITYNELPKEVHETIIWRQWRRYKNHPIAQRVSETYRKKDFEYYSKELERANSHRTKAMYQEKVNGTLSENWNPWNEEFDGDGNYLKK